VVQVIVALAAAAWALSCAGQVAPSGGAPDRIPPIVSSTVPDTNSVRVSTHEIILTFSKYVDRRSLEESIFISPYLGALEFEWSGREVTIKFKDTLRARTTYVVNVGTDVVDLRERNRMGSGFTLAFSTGDSIDQGMIRGRVYDDRPEGLMVFAYRLGGINPDTLDPARTRPDFIMQTGEGGRFTFSNLALGGYRVFAVRDEYRNLIYDREIDEIGVPSGDIFLDRKTPSVDGVFFRLQKEDTTRPFVMSAAALTRRRVDVRLSEPVDSTRFGQSRFELSDTLSGRQIPVLGAFWKRGVAATAELMLGAPLDSPATYRVRAAVLFDRASNPLNEKNNSAVFDGVLRPDTVATTISVIGLRDSARGVRPDAPLGVETSEPVHQRLFERAILLSDSLRRPVRWTSSWESSNRLWIAPDVPLHSNAWYRLSVIMDSVQDLRGMRFKDSVFVLRFQTLDMRKTGEIEGQVVDSHSRGFPYRITAESVDLSPRYERSTSIAAPGRFVLRQLLEGNYRISAFEDVGAGGRYSPGVPHPFSPSERFTVLGDSVKVRARWGVQGVVLQFK
jgi:hypothetical protein